MSKRFQGCQNTGILSKKVPAHSLPFGNLLVMMKPESLELHPSKMVSGEGSSIKPGKDAVASVRKRSPSGLANTGDAGEKYRH